MTFKAMFFVESEFIDIMTRETKADKFNLKFMNILFTPTNKLGVGMVQHKIAENFFSVGFKLIWGKSVGFLRKCKLSNLLIRFCLHEEA